MQKNDSETLFEQFCTSHNIRWEAIPTEAGKTPDYFIYLGREKIAAEVKQIQANTKERAEDRQFRETRLSAGGCTLGDRLRNIIITAGKQLRVKAKGQYPAIIVIYNPQFLLQQHTEPHAIKAAMYGFDTIILDLPGDVRDKPRVLDRKSGGRRMMTDEENTSISAIAVLGSSGLTVYHNVFAEIPLKPKLCKGVTVQQFTLGEKRPGEFAEWQEIS